MVAVADTRYSVLALSDGTPPPALNDVIERLRATLLPLGRENERNMLGARIDRFDVAAIAFGGPGVEQVCRPGRDVVDGRDRQVSGAQGHVARSRPTAVARRRAQAFGTPRREAAVEKSHVGDTRPPQQPG